MMSCNYTDHASVDESDFPVLGIKHQRKGPRGGVKAPFPMKLYNLLQDNLYEDVISWQPHGRSFLVDKPHEFVKKVMPKYFQQSKLTSFQRQLNLYGFTRILASGPDRGGYYHELFLRGKEKMSSHIIRMKIKGPRTKVTSNHESEPKFYQMKFLPTSERTSSTPRSATTECISIPDDDFPPLYICCTSDSDDHSLSSCQHLESPSNVTDLDYSLMPMSSSMMLSSDSPPKVSSWPSLVFPFLSPEISEELTPFIPDFQGGALRGCHQSDRSPTIGHQRKQYYEDSCSLFSTEDPSTALKMSSMLEAQDKLKTEPLPWDAELDLSEMFDYAAGEQLSFS